MNFYMHLSSFVNKKTTTFYIVNIIITVKISQTRINEFLIDFKIANNTIRLYRRMLAENITMVL